MRPKRKRLSRPTGNRPPSTTRRLTSISVGERRIPVETRLSASPAASKGDGSSPVSTREKSVDERDVRSHGLAVQIKTDRALLVGAVGFHPRLLQPLQHFAAARSLHISRGDTADGVARTKGRPPIAGASPGTVRVREL